MATLFTKSMTRMHPTTNFSKYFLSELQQHANSKGVKETPYLGAGHMLTRIVYQALGEINNLPEVKDTLKIKKRVVTPSQSVASASSRRRRLTPRKVPPTKPEVH